MRFKIYIFTILSVIILSLILIGSVNAKDIGTNDTQVISANDNEEIVKVENDLEKLKDNNEEGRFSDLQNEIGSGGNINLTKSKYSYNRFLDGFNSIKIYNSGVIDGKGAVIDMRESNNVQVFEVLTTGVTIKNLTIMNAKFNGNGGAIGFSGSGTVENCNFINNQAKVGGAVSFGKNGKSSVINCNFTNNKANDYKGHGGAIFFDYSSSTHEVMNCNFIDNQVTGEESCGAAVYFNSRGNVINCTFTNNQATGENCRGGAVWTFNGRVTNCNFTNNKVTMYGGAVYIHNIGSVTNCNFTNNKASQYGGAVFSSINKVDVNECNFIENQANLGGAVVCMKEQATLTNCNFIENQANSGGAVHFNDPSIVINCTFTNNQATKSNGGAIYFNLNCTVINCSFNNNQANNTGGAILMLEGTMINCSFNNNKASQYGGAVFIYNANTFLTNCNFVNNSANQGGSIYCAIEAATADTCIIKTPSDTTVNICFLSPVLNVDDFTSVYRSGKKLTFDLKTNGGMSVDNGNISISVYYNGTLFGKYSCLSGEGWIPDLPAGSYKATYDTDYEEFIPVTKTITVTLPPKHTFWVLNYTINSHNGPVINLNNNFDFDFDYDANFTEGIVINRPLTINGNGYTIDAKDVARIFKVESNDVVLKNIIFKNGNTSSHGGAVYFNSDGDVTNCTFTGNQASQYGGAVYFDKTGTTTNCTFTGNEATDGYGGAVWMDSGNVTNCNFAGNNAKYNGGAVFFYAGEITTCNFTNNQANYGGAVYFYGNGHVTNCNFLGNIANRGSAIYFYSKSSTKIVSDSCFLNNRAKAEELLVTKNVKNIIIVFMGGNNLLNAIYSRNDAEVTFTNVTYWGAKGMEKTDNNAKPSRSINESGQNISIGIIVNDKIVLEEVKVTDENGRIVLNITAGDSYYINVRHDTDSYYTQLEKTIQHNPKFIVNVTSQKTNNLDVNITAKSNILGTISGYLLFFVSNYNQIKANYVGNGTWWAVHHFDNYGSYQVNASHSELKNVNANGGTITIKTNSTITQDNIVLNYGDSINVTVKTQGAIGIVADIDGENVDVINNYTIPISGLGAGNYTLTIKTLPDDEHDSVTKSVIITVNKVNSTLIVGDVVLDYGNTINVTVSAEGAVGIVAEIDGYGVGVDGFTIAISDLKAGNHTLTVIAVADENHTSVSKTVTITVNKVNSTLIVGDVVLDYGNTINVTVSAEGAVGIVAEIDGYGVGVDGFTIAISDLKAGNHTLTVIAVADENHTSVSKTVTITVNKVNSTLNVSDIVFDYGSSGLGEISSNGATGINASIINQPNAVIIVNGTKITVSDLDVGTYILTVTTIPDENHIPVTANATVIVNKLKTELTGNTVTTIYNINKDLVITLKDNFGKALTGALITVDLNGAKTYTTDSNGQINVSTKGLTPNIYTAKVTFNGNTNYVGSSKDIKVTVKKATPKMNAKKKTYKSTTKTKKYPIALKDNTGKPIKKAKVALKVNGKKYKAKTNRKGKATFKITKLNNKGVFKAVIKYKGNKYYNKVSKKLKIKIIVTFQTVSRGSKDKDTVKVIQQALKDHGYYLTYRGHYLKIDGKYNKCTVKSIKEFQQDNGLKVTGRADENTAKKLGII